MTDETPAPAPEAPVTETKPSVLRRVFETGKRWLQNIIGLIGKYPGTALLVAVVTHVGRSFL